MRERKSAATDRIAKLNKEFAIGWSKIDIMSDDSMKPSRNSASLRADMKTSTQKKANSETVKHINTRTYLLNDETTMKQIEPKEHIITHEIHVK